MTGARCNYTLIPAGAERLWYQIVPSSPEIAADAVIDISPFDDAVNPPHALNPAVEVWVVAHHGLVQRHASIIHGVMPYYSGKEPDVCFSGGLAS